jgi:hypothetical protein
MYDNQKYNLDSGPFGLCTGYWDENNNTFRKFGSTDTYKCCLTSCIPEIEECYKLCNNVKKGSISRCNKICKDIEKSCHDYCQLSTPHFWGMDDPIYEIIKKFGCGDGYYNTIDKKCIEINKDAIVNICNKNCIPTRSIGCENHCKYMYDSLINSNISISKKNKSISDKVFVKPIEDKSDYILYVLYAIFIGFILVALYIFKTKMIY